MNRDVATLLRLEGLVVLVAVVVVYARLDASWLMFALLFLVPDVSMVGYLKDPGIGARVYNAVHTYVGPALLFALGWWSGAAIPVHIALIWIGHIGFDRVLGYGLKYPTAFTDTHLGSMKQPE